MTISPAHEGASSLKGNRLRGFDYNSSRCRSSYTPEQARHDPSIVAETFIDVLDNCLAPERNRR